MSKNSYSLLKRQYDYLLPVYGIASGNRKLYHRYDSRRGIDYYFFIGSHEEYLEALSRTKYLDRVNGKLI